MSAREGRGIVGRLPRWPTLGLVLLLAGCAAGASAPDPVTTDPPLGAPVPASMDSVRIPSAGVRMNGIVYLPAGAGPHPVALMLHGLPGDERNLDLAQAIRRAGWAVVFFHYRGAWGSPGDFSFGHVLEDVEAAVDWTLDPGVRRRFAFDGRPRALVGHSMGGFAALTAGSRHPGVDCIAAMAPGNIGRMAALAASPEAQAATARQLDAWVTGPLAGTGGRALVGEVVAARGAYDLVAQAPVIAERNLLLVAGERDRVTLKAEHVDPLVEALRAASAPRLQLRVLPSDHAFSDQRIALARTVTGWLNEYCP